LIRWWCKKYQRPRNHPLLLDSTQEDLADEWMDDQILNYIVNSETPVDPADLEYKDVFPDNDEDDPDAFDAIMNRLLQNEPEEDIAILIERAKKIADRKKRREK